MAGLAELPECGGGLREGLEGVTDRENPLTLTRPHLSRSPTSLLVLLFALSYVNNFTAAHKLFSLSL